MKFRVTIERILVATNVFEVQAENEDAARDIAMDEAKEYEDWVNDYPDYEINDVDEARP